MAALARQDARRRKVCGLLLVVFFVFLVFIIVDQVAIFSWLVFFVFVVFFIHVFVDIDFGGTFRATDHGSTLRTVVCLVGVRGPCPPLCSVLYTAAYEVNSRAWWRCFERHRTMRTRTFEWPLPENTPNGRWLASAG